MTPLLASEVEPFRTANIRLSVPLMHTASFKIDLLVSIIHTLT